MALLSLLEVLAFTVSLLREGRTFPGITAWAAVSKVVALLPHRDLNTQLRRLILIVLFLLLFVFVCTTTCGSFRSRNFVS